MRTSQLLAGLVGGLAVTLAAGGRAEAQSNRVIQGDWEVVTLASGCKAILSYELEMSWGPDPNARFAWSGGCSAQGLITGQGKLTTEFTTREGTRFRLEKTGVAADGMFTGNTSEASYSNADDFDDRTPAGTMQLHDFGDVRNPMPSFYKDGCAYHTSNGVADMSRALFDCQASTGAALRNQVLAGGSQQAQASPPAPARASSVPQTWTKADAEPCRAPIAAYKQAYIAVEQQYANDYRPGGKFADADNYAFSQRNNARLQSLDPVSAFFFDGAVKCDADENARECGELGALSLFGPKGFEVIMAEAPGSDYIKALRAYARGVDIDGNPLPAPEPSDPNEGFYSSPDVRAALSCLAGVWTKKYDASRGLGQPPTGAAAPPPSSTLSATLANPTAGTPGGPGGYVSLGLPDPGAPTRSGPPIPKDLPTGPPAARSGATGRGAAILGGTTQAKPAPPATDPTPVNNCIAIDKRNGDAGTIYGGFRNSCNFSINFTMCNESPPKDSWAEAFSCVNSKGKMDGFLETIGSSNTVSAHVASRGMVYWFACRFPLTPGDVEYRPGQGIFARCK